MRSVSPVIHLESSEAKNTAAGAIPGVAGYPALKPPSVCRGEAAPTRRLVELSLIGRASRRPKFYACHANARPGDVANVAIPTAPSCSQSSGRLMLMWRDYCRTPSRPALSHQAAHRAPTADRPLQRPEAARSRYPMLRSQRTRRRQHAGRSRTFAAAPARPQR